MKMPDNPIDPRMFAPCGMNCMVCYKHCFHKKPCGGCLPGDAGKPRHCRQCKIKDCVKDRGIAYCYECDRHPCPLVKGLDKSYRTRYGASLLENSQVVKEYGLTHFMEEQKAKFTCPACGGVISLHDKMCGECGRPTEKL